MSLFDTILVQPLFNILMGLYSIIPGGDFGVSIIVFTILIRFALYPMVKRQLHQSRAMRKIQPELEKIKKKAKGDKQMQGMLMLELYKEHNIKPFSSMLPLIVQLPIFIALFRVIRIMTDHRDQVEQFAYSFTQHLQPVQDLINSPKSFDMTLFKVVDLTNPAISSHGIDFILIGLALLSAFSQFIITKQTSPTPEGKKRLRDIFAEAAQGKEPDQAAMTQAMMGNMMKIFPILMFFIMVSVPGGLALYYGSSNLVALLQQKYILRGSEEELTGLAAKAARKTAAQKRAQKAKKAKTAPAAAPTKATPKKSVKATPVKKKTTPKTPKVPKEPTVTRISAKDTGRKKS